MVRGYRCTVIRHSAQAMLWQLKLNRVNPWISKVTLKDNTVFFFFYCFTFFTCGGPWHFSTLKQCSGILFSSENSLFIHLWKKSLYFYLYINSVSLNFISKTTQCPFKYVEYFCFGLLVIYLFKCTSNIDKLSQLNIVWQTTASNLCLKLLSSVIPCVRYMFLKQ